MLVPYWCVWGLFFWLKHPLLWHFHFVIATWPLQVFLCIQLDPGVPKTGPTQQYEKSWCLWQQTPRSSQWTVASNQCLRVIWQTEAPRPKKNNIVSSKCHFSLVQSMCFFCTLSSKRPFFFPTLSFCRGFLPRAFLHLGVFLFVTILRWYFRPALNTREQIIGSVFAIWAITQSIQMIVFHFLPHLLFRLKYFTYCPWPHSLNPHTFILKKQISDFMRRCFFMSCFGKEYAVFLMHTHVWNLSPLWWF